MLETVEKFTVRPLPPPRPSWFAAAAAAGRAAAQPARPRQGHAAPAGPAGARHGPARAAPAAGAVARPLGPSLPLRRDRAADHGAGGVFDRRGAGLPDFAAAAPVRRRRLHRQHPGHFADPRTRAGAGGHPDRRAQRLGHHRADWRDARDRRAGRDARHGHCARLSPGDAARHGAGAGDAADQRLDHDCRLAGRHAGGRRFDGRDARVFLQRAAGGREGVATWCWRPPSRWCSAC